LYEDGMPVPVLDDAPTVPYHLAWAMDLFRDLRSCRPIGMSGYAPIPVTMMRTYFDQCGMPSHLWHEAKLYCTRLDYTELEHLNKKLSAKLPKIPEGGK